MKKFTARTWLVIFLLSGLVVSARWEPLAISARAQTKDQHVDFAEQYRQLVRLILRKEYVEAVVHGKRLIESTDEYLEAYRRIAQAAKEAQQLDLLKAYFLAVSQLTPDGPLPHYGLGLVYQELNEISAALAEFKLCLRLRPTFTAALKAALDLPRENAQEIEAILTELRAGAPESWVVPFGQGLYAARVNKPEEGLAHFDEALARNPEAAEVCYQKALLLGLRNRSAPALSALAACFPRLLPQLNEAQQIDVLYLSGSLAARLGNREQAEEQLQRAAQLAKAMGDEQYTGAYLANKAILNQQQGDYAAALLASQAALTLARKGTGRGAEILAGRNLVQAGRALYLLGDYQQARSYYAEGLSYAKKWKETSNEALINHYLGDLLAATGDYKQAVNHYRAAVALKRERADAESQHLTYTALVRLSLQTGDLSQAQAALQEMLRLGQESGDLRLGLNALAAQGELQMRLGRLEQALLSYTELLQQASPQGYAEFTWLAQAGLAQVYQRSQQYEKARAAYQEAIRVMENARARLNAPEDKAGFFQDKVEVYKNLIGVLLELASQPSPGDFKTEAFYYSERARA
ncbi:MAG: tetratricopeptide repeat protein, partial [Acidobacteria bacterium]|nr:tetratricopeptide repeat protein [Acidobacteriota bacterium]